MCISQRPSKQRARLGMTDLPSRWSPINFIPRETSKKGRFDWAQEEALAKASQACSFLFQNSDFRFGSAYHKLITLVGEHILVANLRESWTEITAAIEHAAVVPIIKLP